MEYPHCLASFIEGIDDGQMAVHELQAESRSRRVEKYSATLTCSSSSRWRGGWNPLLQRT